MHHRQGYARKLRESQLADGPVLVAYGHAARRRALGSLFDAEAGGCLIVRDARGLLAMASHAGVIVLDAQLGTGMADTLSLLRERHPSLPVVIVSARHSADEMHRALELGASSYTRTAVAGERLRHLVAAARAGHALLETDLVRHCQQPIGTAQQAAGRAVIESLAAAVKAKDTVTSRHLHEVAELAVRLARVVAPELAETDGFRFGCMLHDLGKIGVADRILSKPGPLDPDEWREMRRHPETGERVIRSLGLADTVREIVLHHHERWDGTGYPAGLADVEIPLAARIFAVCDALEAMTADRPYRAALPVDAALDRLSVGAGRQFDPEVVAALNRALASGEIYLSSLVDRENVLV